MWNKGRPENFNAKHRGDPVVAYVKQSVRASNDYRRLKDDGWAEEGFVPDETSIDETNDWAQ